jgi:hypothetical protein
MPQQNSDDVFGPGVRIVPITLNLETEINAKLLLTSVRQDGRQLFDPLLKILVDWSNANTRPKIPPITTAELLQECERLNAAGKGREEAWAIVHGRAPRARFNKAWREVRNA